MGFYLEKNWVYLRIDIKIKEWLILKQKKIPGLCHDHLQNFQVFVQIKIP